MTRTVQYNTNTIIGWDSQLKYVWNGKPTFDKRKIAIIRKQLGKKLVKEGDDRLEKYQKQSELELLNAVKEAPEMFRILKELMLFDDGVRAEWIKGRVLLLIKKIKGE